MRKRHVVCVLLSGAACVACWALLSPRKPAPVVSTPPVATKAEKAAPVPRVEPRRSRRDAEFWPQAPRPIALRQRVETVRLNAPLPEGLTTDTPTTWLVQFGGPLDADAVRAWKAAGLEPLTPSVAGAWHVRATYNALRDAPISIAPRMLGWSRLQPRDRILPPVAAAMQDAEPKLRLELYPGANGAALMAELRAQKVLLRDNGRDALEITLPDADAAWPERLAAYEGVYAIDGARPRKAPTNEAAATDSRIDLSIGGSRNLTGNGVTLLVRDEGRIFGHSDFGARIVLGPDVLTATPVRHSTHVAGTIGGTGATDAGALARGMASSVRLINYDLNGDDVQEVLDAFKNHGAVLSNHSYGFVIGWDGPTFNNNQAQFGMYSSFARNWDVIARDQNLVIVKSVGNDRNDGGSGFPHDGTLGADGIYYDSVESSATGKNYLVVGGARDGIQAGTPFGGVAAIDASSAGPTDDGRIKPEIMANGENVHSCNDSLVAGNQYTTLSGTSMASAVASGAVTLLTQRYQQMNGSSVVPTQHWFRALLAHTATDMGRTGPDYLHGFGMLDLESAMTLLETDSTTGAFIRSSTLSATTPERYFLIASNGVTPIRATVCWTDAPGDLLAAKQLVNDVDVQLVRASDGSIALPYILDKAQPHLPAARGVNSVDTIELLEFTPVAAGEYFFSVRGGTLASDAPFAIVSSHAMTENFAPVANLTSTATVGAPPLKVDFTGAASFDSDGTIVRYVWDFGDGQSAEGLQVTHTYAQGSYTARLTVYDDKGGVSTDTTIVAVANEPPRAAVSASPTQGPPPLNVLFSATDSSDPDGSIVKYEWDFGDGTVGQGPLVEHTFSSPGVFFVFLTVTDNGSSRDTTSMVIVAGDPLTISSSSFSLNFKTPSRDTFRLKTRTQLVPPDAVTVAGVTGTLYIGTGQFPFTLNEKGRFKVPPLNITLTIKSTRFSATLSKASLSGALAASGAVSKTTKNQLVRLPVAIQLSTGAFIGSTGVLFNYTANQGRTGRGKAITR